MELPIEEPRLGRMAEDLALEIRHVVATTQGVIHGLQSRQLQGKPDWLRLRVGIKGKKGAGAPTHTVRDYILYRHAKGNFPEERDVDSTKVAEETQKIVAVSPLGFDFTSSIYTLQIDHFFSENNFLKKIDEISEDQDLRKEIKKKLIEMKQVSGDDWDRNFINKLIPPGNETMIALKCIYYNYSANLWPVSGSSNSSKGSRSDFESALYCVNQELDAMGASLNNDARTATMEALEKFEGYRESHSYIIPHILLEKDTLMTGLEFFLLTPAGKAAKTICANIAKIGQIGMELAYPLATQLQNPETRSKAKGMCKAIKILRKVRKQQLPHPSDFLSDAERDSSSLSSIGIEVLVVNREQFSQAIEQSNRKKVQRKIKSELRDTQNQNSELDHSKSAQNSGGAESGESEWENDEDTDNECNAEFKMSSLR